MEEKNNAVKHWHVESSNKRDAPWPYRTKRKYR